MGYQVTTVNVTPYALHALHEPLPTVTAQVLALTLRAAVPPPEPAAARAAAVEALPKPPAHRRWA